MGIEVRGRKAKDLAKDLAKALRKGEKALVARVFRGREGGSKARLQVRTRINWAMKCVTLFLTVTLITALLIGWSQVVCFLHNFSLARVRPRSLRHFREHTHCQCAAGDANEHVI